MSPKDRRKKAFSLVEIMIAVAIIGILTAVAQPMYQKYKMRTIQTSGKLELSQGFAFESAFYAANNTYHGNLCYIGWIPESITVTAGTASVKPGFKRYYGYATGGRTGGCRSCTDVPLPNLAGPANCFGAMFASNCYPANIAHSNGWCASYGGEFVQVWGFRHNIFGTINPLRGWDSAFGQMGDSWTIDNDGKITQTMDGM